MPHQISRSEYPVIAKMLWDGEMIPFLGAGVNLATRNRPTPWDQTILPDARDLAHHLASELEYNGPDKSNLLRISQYYEALKTRPRLTSTLHRVFDHDYDITSIHQFIANLPAKLKPQPHNRDSNLLVVTTNYDDVLERAFQEAGQPYDVLSYVSNDSRIPSEHHHFRIRLSNGEETVLEDPEDGLDLGKQQALILKIHGAVHRNSEDRDSYVITEDDYIEYLVQADISNMLPPQVVSRLRNAHFLFLGYSLADWNFRVWLRRMQEKKDQYCASWAVQLRVSDTDERQWFKRGVKLAEVDLQDFITRISREFDKMLARKEAQYAQ